MTGRDKAAIGRFLFDRMRARLPFPLFIIVILAAAPAQATDLNGFRKANGLKPLKQNASLNSMAKAHAVDMARRRSMDHSGFHAKRAARGAAGENVSYGCASISCAMDQWIASPPHRANMLRPDFTRYGVASAVSASGQRFWTLLFGR